MQALAALPLKRLALRCIGGDLQCAKGLALGLAHARLGGPRPLVADGWRPERAGPSRQDRAPGAVAGESGRRVVRAIAPSLAAARTRTAGRDEPHFAEPRGFGGASSACR